ncbi:MAG: TVP38/TMEM64 family protein [Planctomycetaceae bacterium]
MNRRPWNRRLDVIPWLLLVIMASWGIASWMNDGIVAEITQPGLSHVERLAIFVDAFRAMGHWAPLAYIGFVCIEVVVAPIPGLMLYAPGGLVFGPVFGGVLATIGNTLGAGLACWLSRSFGERWVQQMAPDSRFAKLQGLIERRGFWILFLLRLNPLTSSDLLSYAAGLTRMPVWHVMAASGLGMAPLCLIQSWLSDSVFNRWPFLLWPLLIAGVVYVVIVVVVISRLLRTPGRKLPGEGPFND